MRVLLVDQFGEMGGAQFGLVEAAGGFVVRGWKSFALTPAGPLQQRLAHLGVDVEPLICGPYESVRKSSSDLLRFARQIPTQVSAIRRAIRKHSIDVLYVNGPRVVPAAALARIGRPIVFHSHSVVQQKTAAWLTGAALSKSNGTVLLSSQFVAEWLRPYVAADRMHVVYNGVAPCRRPPRRRDRFRRVGVLGRIAPEKQQLLFIEAAHLAAAHDPGLQFLICGGPVLANPAYYTAVQSAAGSTVALQSWTDDVADFLDQIDLLVVPSARYDTNPRVIIEAFAAGVPVLAFDSGGIPELIENRVSGVLVRQHDTASLARAIVAATSRPALLQEIARKGHERWRRQFTLQRFQSEVCVRIEAAVSETRGARSVDAANLGASEPHALQKVRAKAAV